jgi:hypothetical protein
MKLAIRIFAIAVVVAGATAATVAPKTANAVVSHQSASASAPKPGCTIHLPCPVRPGDDE